MMMPHIIVPSDETVLLPNVFEKFVSSPVTMPFIMLFIICSTVMSPNMPPCPAASDIMLSSPDRSIESSCPSIIVW